MFDTFDFISHDQNKIKNIPQLAFLFFPQQR